jgi:ABC-type metal ion transport system substrate-binding protein
MLSFPVRIIKSYQSDAVEQAAKNAFGNGAVKGW